MIRSTLLLFVYTILFKQLNAQTRFIYSDTFSYFVLSPIHKDIIMKNAIKKVKSCLYWDIKDSTKKYDEDYLYDTSGNLICHSTNRKDGRVSFSDTLIYNAGEELIEDIWIDKIKPSLFLKTKYEYIGNPVTLKSRYFFDSRNPDFKRGAIEYFDNHQRLLAYVFISDDGTRGDSVQYFYNKEGLIKRIEHMNRENKIVFSYNYEHRFTKQDKRILMWQLSPGKPKTKSYQECIYNNSNQCVSCITYSDENRAIDKREFTYNQDGSLSVYTKTQNGAHGISTSITRYSYFYH